MKKRFLALFVAKLPDEFTIKNNDMDVRVEPVYEKGMQFSGQVFMSGNLLVDISEEEALEMASNHLRAHVDFVKPITIEFRKSIEDPKRNRWAS